MKAKLPCCALVIATVLAGCTTMPSSTPASQPAPAAAEGVQPMAQADGITGSRIPSRRTEKMVSSIGASDYKESTQSMMAPLRSQ